jgi:hypothetical protein
MGFFGNLGSFLGFGGGPDISGALRELEGLPEYGISRGFYLDPSQYRLGPTALEQVSLDPQYKEAQLAALTELSRIGEEGGLTTADRAALQEVAESEAARERGVRAAIAQQARARGLGGSGMELAQQLIAQQGASQTAAQAGRDIAQMAQARALQALTGAGELGGRIRGQEYGEQADLARARDMIEQFNLANRQALAQRQADMAQRIAEMNVGGARDIGSKRANLRLGQAQAAAGTQAERAGGFMGGLLKVGGGILGSLGRSSPDTQGFTQESPYGFTRNWRW